MQVVNTTHVYVEQVSDDQVGTHGGRVVQAAQTEETRNILTAKNFPQVLTKPFLSSSMVKWLTAYGWWRKSTASPPGSEDRHPQNEVFCSGNELKTCTFFCCASTLMQWISKSCLFMNLLISDTFQSVLSSLRHNTGSNDQQLWLYIINCCLLFKKMLLHFNKFRFLVFN